MSIGMQLDPERRSSEFVEFERSLREKVVGQDRAIQRVAHMLQVYQAGMSMPGRPLGNLLFLGPTGTGKTRVVEAAADILFGSPRAFIKIDCGEYQHGHEIAKLLGSPPGYLGHRETPALLTQKALDEHHTEAAPFGFVLFDEIEKAHDSLWQLLLGILDKGTLTLGDNQRVDFSRTVVFLTSNLGAKEITRLMAGGIGFSPTGPDEEGKLDQKIYRTALDAARDRFSPEFMNRIDKVVVFRALNRGHMRRIVDIELQQVQERVIASEVARPFVLRWTDEAKDFLVDEGWERTYGARHLKRAIERHLIFPLSSLMATDQIHPGDSVLVELDERTGKLSFRRHTTFHVIAKTARASSGGDSTTEAEPEGPMGLIASLYDCQPGTVAWAVPRAFTQAKKSGTTNTLIERCYRSLSFGQ